MTGKPIKRQRRHTHHHHRRHHHHHGHQHLTYIALSIDSVRIILIPNQELHVMTDVTLGHTSDLSIQYLDANGNPMLTTPTPDSPPAWSNTTPAVETLTPSPDGNTATLATLAVGQDVVSVSVIVGGQTFSATIGENVTAAPQVLSSIAIQQVVR